MVFGYFMYINASSGQTLTLCNKCAKKVQPQLGLKLDNALCLIISGSDECSPVTESLTACPSSLLLVFIAFRLFHIWFDAGPPVCSILLILSSNSFCRISVMVQKFQLPRNRPPERS